MTGVSESIAGVAEVGELEAFPGLPIAFPRTEAECIELFALARRDRLAVLPLGLASKLNWTAPPAGADFALATRFLSGVVEFEAGDGTLTALAGTPVSELRELVAAEGLELSPDIPRPAEATIGGVIAAGQSGADRLQRGPVRGHLLGTRTLLGSRAVTRSGGRLVKNATGYDLHRLFCGSFGTLGVILEVSLRLFPAPRATAVLRTDFDDLSEALRAAARLRKQRVEARTITIENRWANDRTAPWALHVVLTGFPEPLAFEVERLRAKLDFEPPLEGNTARECADRLRDLEADTRVSDVLHLAALPSKFEEAVALLLERFGGEGSRPLVIQPGIATADLQLELNDPGEAGDRVSKLRKALVPLSARLSVRGPVLRRAAIDPLGTPGEGFALQQRLRDALDPHHLLVSGHFQGGL
jgi:glycolate oxidase FAD binding subunit